MHKNLFTSNQHYRTSEELFEPIQAACNTNPDIATFYELGKSEQGRAIYGAVIGTGKKTISLMAGAHTDEPVGPETLRTFILQGLQNRNELAEWFSKYKFVIIPQINPDGEAINQSWIPKMPDVSAYLQNAFREKPGRDLEFGYPNMRVENKLVSEFLRPFAPFSLHMSLHGMGFSEGAFFLIERHWISRTKELQSKFSDYAAGLGLGLHDHDRNGEKGFLYIGPGFTTTPEGKAMQAYFNGLGDLQMASKFHLSSMEFVRNLGGDPLCLVTELPLFNIPTRSSKKSKLPEAYLEFNALKPQLQLDLVAGKSIQKTIEKFGITALPLDDSVLFQLYTIQLGLENI